MIDESVDEIHVVSSMWGGLSRYSQSFVSNHLRSCDTFVVSIYSLIVSSSKQCRVRGKS